jgi:hypothetical protein
LRKWQKLKTSNQSKTENKMAKQKLHFGMDVTTPALLQVNPREFYKKALLTDSTRTNFRQVLNIKEKTKIGSLSFGTLLHEADCDFQGGNSELGAKEMEPCKLQIGTDVCMYELEQSFLADWMQAGSNGEWMPAEFASHFYEVLGENVAERLEILTFQGDTDYTPEGEDDPMAYLALCDGLEKKLCESEDAQHIAGATITVNNVVAELTKVYNAIPKAIRKRKTEVLWLVSTEIADIYRLAVATQSAEVYTAQLPALNFLGYTLTEAQGLSEGVMLLSLANNYVFLADLVSDPEDLNIIDLSKTTGDKRIRVRADFKFGVDYLNDAEWVTYGLPCAS